MSLRYAGSQLLQTLPSPLLAGANTASLSMWVRVNPGSAVADPAGATFFDGGGRLAVGLSASGDLRVAWSAISGGVADASEWSQALVPGVDHHLAATWQAGAQRYYLNGVLVGTDDRPGVLGRLGADPSQAFRLGPDRAGADVTLDEPTLWVGHALTAANVAALRDRTAQPGAIAPSSLALRWTLAGPDGAPATPGDAGLDDASPTGLDLATVVGPAPTYRAEVLSFSLLDGGCSARVAPSGQGILFKFHDEATRPAPVTTLASNDEQQRVVLNAPPAGDQFTLTFQGQTTAPIPAVPSPPPVYFQWNVPPLAAGQHDLAVNIARGGPFTPNCLYEVFDGATLLGTKVLNMQNDFGGSGGPVNAGMFNDPALLTVGGAAVRWYPLGRFATTGTALKVRVSCPATPSDKVFFNVDCLRVAPVAGGVPVVISSAAPPATLVDELGSRTNRYSAAYQVAGSGADHVDVGGAGAGSRSLAVPADVRSALEALPAIGPGNMSVAGNGDPRTPLVLTFAGDLAQSALPLITASDPAIDVARVYQGGVLPAFKVNGVIVPTGGPGYREPYWGEGRHELSGAPRAKLPYLSTVYFPLLQASPAKWFGSIGQHQNTYAGHGWNRTEDLAVGTPGRGLKGYATVVRVSDNPAATATFKEVPLKAATYRVSATWPHGPGLSAAVTYTVRGRDGATLGSLTVDQSVAPSGDLDAGVRWQVIGTFTLAGLSGDLVVTQANGTSARMIADAIRYERTSPDDSRVIAPGDVVTYSAGTGWASTAAGEAPAATDAPVENLAGTPIYPPLPTSRRMDMGFGLGGFNYYSTNYCYYNVASGIDSNGIVALAKDPDGYPTRLATPSTRVLTHVYQPSYQADGKGWPALDPGDYVLIWDGASDVRLAGETENAPAQLAGTTNRKRFYRLNASPESYGVPYLETQFFGTGQNGDGSWNCDVRNLRIFPILPGVDYNNPPKFHPNHVARLSAVQVIRPMDQTSTIVGNATDFADYNRPQSHLSKGSPPRRLRIPIAEIRPYAGPEIWSPYEGQPWRITTVNPHGLSDGQFIEFDAGIPIGLTRHSNGQEIEFAFMFGHIRVLSPTEIYFTYGARQYDPSAPPYTASEVFTTPACPIVVSIGSPMPIADIVEQCNTCDLDLHFNVAVSATDDCIIELGRYIARNLAAGKKCRAAYSNECWNTGLKTYDWCVKQNYATGLGGYFDWIPYYVQQAKRVWDLMAIGFAEEGRPGDLIRLLESQWGYPAGTTNPMLIRAAALGLEFDELAIAPYYHNECSFTLRQPGEPRFAPWLDLLTADQILDFYEMFSVFGGWKDEVGWHKDYIDNVAILGPNPADPSQEIVVGYDRRYRGVVDVIFYEGGPEYMLPPFATARKGQRSHATHRHPRFFGILLNTFRQYDDAGCKLFNQYYLDGKDRDGFEMWSAANGTSQLPYFPGDPAQDAIQVEQFDRLDVVKSVMVGAVHAYAALPLATDAPTPATSYAISGPIGGTVGSPSASFSIVPNGVYTGTITITPSGGGLTSPIVRTFSGSSAPQSFAITPTAAGTVTLTPTNDGGLADPAARTYAAAAPPPPPATSYTLTGPTSGTVGVASGSFTVMPNGVPSAATTVSVALSGGGLSGSVVLSFTTAAPQTFTITPTAAGTVTLTPANNGGLADPAARTYAAAAPPPPPATAYAFTGPTGGTVGVTSSAFTVTPNGVPSSPTAVAIALSGGGLSGSVVLSFATAAPQTFSIAPTAVGTVTLTPTNDGGLTNPAARSYTAAAPAATSYTLTGPASGTVGVASGSFTVTPNGVPSAATTVSVALSGGGLSGSVVLSFTTAAPQTFTITPTAAGTVTLTPSNDRGLADPAARTYDAVNGSKRKKNPQIPPRSIARPVRPPFRRCR